MLSLKVKELQGFPYNEFLGLQSTASMPTGVATTTTNPDLIVPSISIDGLSKGMQNMSMDREVSEGKTFLPVPFFILSRNLVSERWNDAIDTV